MKSLYSPHQRKASHSHPVAVARTVGEPVLGRAHPCNGWVDPSTRRMNTRPSAHVKLILFCLLVILKPRCNDAKSRLLPG